MPANPLTKEELEDAARLKKLFHAWQERQKMAGQPSSQGDASEALGFNQSSLSQYVNGKIPLNIDAAVKFARVFGCKIAEFSLTIAAEILDAADRTGEVPGRTKPMPLGATDAEEQRILTAFRLADDRGRDQLNSAVDAVLNRLEQARRYK